MAPQFLPFSVLPRNKAFIPGWSQTCIVCEPLHSPLHVVFHPFRKCDALPVSSSISSHVSPRDGAGGEKPAFVNITVITRHPLHYFSHPYFASCPSHFNACCGSHAPCGRGCAIPSRPFRGPTFSPSTPPHARPSSSRYDPPPARPRPARNLARPARGGDSSAHYQPPG
jgi:hypothetical protein